MEDKQQAHTSSIQKTMYYINMHDASLVCYLVIELQKKKPDDERQNGHGMLGMGGTAVSLDPFFNNQL